MQVVALILAAGEGVRLAQGRPKALVRLGGRTLLGHSAAALGYARGVDAVLPVVPPGAEGELLELKSGWSAPARLLDAVEGGSTRQASLACGLRAAREQAPSLAWVLVHDAARALVEPADAEAVLEAARETGAALPVIPAADTVKEVEGGRVLRTLERGRLAFAQTPQAFRASLLEEALARAELDGFVATDCSALVEHIGGRVRICPGRPENIKLTHPADLQRAEAFLAARGPL